MKKQEIRHYLQILRKNKYSEKIVKVYENKELAVRYLYDNLNRLISRNKGLINYSDIAELISYFYINGKKNKKMVCYYQHHYCNNSNSTAVAVRL
mgnify:CR=1 FL=1